MFILKWLLLLIGLCIIPLVNAGQYYDIYINHPFPVINTTTIVSGGSLVANTTYFFQCAYTIGYRGYYGNDCFSGMGDEFNVTTNDTHKTIELRWGYMNTSGIYVAGYPYPMTNILCRWDTQTFRNATYTYGYFEWNRVGSDAGAGHPNWTSSAYYGGLTVYTGNAKNLTSIGVGSNYGMAAGGTGIGADSINIPYFAMKSSTARNISYSFDNIRNGSICIWANSTQNSLTLYSLWREKVRLNIRPGDRMSLTCDHHNGDYCWLDLYGSFFGLGNTSMTWEGIHLYDHSYTQYPESGRFPGFRMNYSVLSAERAGGSILYNAPRAWLENSMMMAKQGALSYGSVASLNNNNLHLISGAPSVYYNGKSNYQFTGQQNSNIYFNDRYPYSTASYRLENHTYNNAYIYITHNCDATAYNRIWNRTTLTFNNLGYTCASSQCIQDIRFEDAISTCGNTSWFQDDFYNVYSYRNGDGIPIVRHANYTTTPNATQTFYNTLKVLFTNTSGVAQVGINISTTSADGTIVRGVSNATGYAILKVPEYKTWYNKSVATWFTTYQNLTPVYVNISINVTQLNGFYYNGYGRKDWVYNVDLNYCPAVGNTFAWIDFVNDGNGLLLTG